MSQTPDSPIVELVRKIATALVDETQLIEITELSGNMTHVMELKVA